MTPSHETPELLPCDLCGRVGRTEDLQEYFKTKNVHSLCESCGRKADSRLRSLRKLTKKRMKIWLERKRKNK